MGGNTGEATNPDLEGLRRDLEEMFCRMRLKVSILLRLMKCKRGQDGWLPGNAVFKEERRAHSKDVES